MFCRVSLGYTTRYICRVSYKIPVEVKSDGLQVLWV